MHPSVCRAQNFLRDRGAFGGFGNLQRQVVLPRKQGIVLDSLYMAVLGLRQCLELSITLGLSLRRDVDNEVVAASHVLEVVIAVTAPLTLGAQSQVSPRYAVLAHTHAGSLGSTRPHVNEDLRRCFAAVLQRRNGRNSSGYGNPMESEPPSAVNGNFSMENRAVSVGTTVS